MNYRHQYHAGNFADVMKHVLLVQLLRALQVKEKGLLYLDTHAGRGSYDLSLAGKGDSRLREPEWPSGIGRLWTKSNLDPSVAAYVELVRQFDHDRGNRDTLPRSYPGSPWFARLLARPQDRLALCEKHAEEVAALSEEFRFSPRTTVQPMDGYVALRAMLPPPERRALVLIDPAYEEQDELLQTISALREGVSRLPGGVFAIWYPLTQRAGVDRFFDELIKLRPLPTLVMELTIAGERSTKSMRGSGLVVVNPPWKFDLIAQPLLRCLSEMLAQEPGGESNLQWLVPEA